MNREQLKHLAVAGTVTFPATFPRLAEIRLQRDRDLPSACEGQDATFLIAIERSSVRVTINRVVPVSDVRAVFLPRDRNSVNLDDGIWLLGPEVGVGISSQTANNRCLYGIVYVAEHTPTLLKVEAGMTAAESSQYYPPLPSDRSVNHYDPYRDGPGSEFQGRSLNCDPYDECHPPQSASYVPIDHRQRSARDLRPCECFDVDYYPSDEGQR